MTTSTPNTPANGGQILTDERIEELALKNGINKSYEHFGSRYYTELGSHLFMFARAIEADLRAALADPAIPTVDRNAAVSAVWFAVNKASFLFFANEGLARKYVSSVPASIGGGIEVGSAPVIGMPQPAAQGAVLTEDEQITLMVKVEDYMAAVDWAGTQTHAKCDAAEAAIFAKVNEIIQSRATPADDKTAEGK